MGWSCSADASRTLQALEAFATATYRSSNLITGNTFFELDNIEHDDGRITGDVMTLRGGSMGAFEISGDGRLAAMPTLDQKAFFMFCNEAEGGRHRRVADVNKAPTREASYDVTVKARHESGEETILGTVTVAASSQKEARQKAHDELWDARLTAASCSAHYDVRKHHAKEADTTGPTP